MLSPLALLLAHVCASQPVCPSLQGGPHESGPDLTQAELASAVEAEPSDGWRHSLALYFLAAGLDGESTIKGLDADVDVSFSDIWDHLEAGAMLAYRAESQRYALTLDLIYMGLAGEKDKGPLSTDVELDELVVEVDGCLRVNPRTDVLVGARYWGLDGELEISGPGSGQSADGQESWVDPLVGARHTLPFSENLSLTVRGDVGGFGLGSDFSWQALARLNWDISSAVTLTAGYRVVDVDYSDGSGSDEFRYDVMTSGVLAGLILNF